MQPSSLTSPRSILSLGLTLTQLLLANPILRADDVPAAPTDAPTEEYVTPPIIQEGTPADALKFDPVVPAFQRSTSPIFSTGNVAKDLANDLPFHFNTNGRPGNSVGVIGVGKGAEETDVNLLGIPINGPQGGGVDLAQFPQFFWSGYTYQLGPALGAYDPRGVGGSLSLRLWTQEALGSTSTRVQGLASTREIQQISAAQSYDRVAVLAGVTTGLVTGPAFSLSGKPLVFSKTQVTTHLLYNRIDVEGFQSERNTSARATQQSDRVIGIVQVDHEFERNTRLKSSIFYDHNYVRYQDDTVSVPSLRSARGQQLGIENALLTGDTRIGLGLRHVEYNNNQILSKIPTERVANLQITQSFRSGAWLIEPTLGGNGVNRVGLYPIATLGVRHEEGGFGKFLRVGQHRRFPSLLDRYYEAVIPVGPQRLQVLPNADLKPETVRSVELGVDYKNQSHRAQIQGFARSYRDARYTKVTRVNAGLLQYQIVNGGDAWVGGAMTSYDYSPWSLLDVGARATYQRSNLKELSLPFPYSPDWVGILKADLHDRLRRYSLEAVWKGATASKAYSETSTTGAQKVPGYAYMDLFARVRIGEVWTLTGGVENIFDRLIEFRQGVPDGLGRVYSLSGSAVF